MTYAYTKKLFIAYLKVRRNQASCILSGHPVPGLSLPWASQSRQADPLALPEPNLAFPEWESLVFEIGSSLRVRIKIALRPAEGLLEGLPHPTAEQGLHLGILGCPGHVSH